MLFQDSGFSSFLTCKLLFESVISQLYLNYSIFPQPFLALTHSTIIPVRKTTNLKEYQTNKNY